MRRLLLLLNLLAAVALIGAVTSQTFAQAATPTPTAADVTLGSSIQVTFGQTLKFQYFSYDALNQQATARWQTAVNSTNLTGRYFTAVVGQAGTTYYFTNGTALFSTSLTFASAGVQNVVNLNTIEAFGAAHAQ